MDRNKLEKPRSFLDKLRGLFGKPGDREIEDIEEALIAADIDLQLVDEAVELIKKSGSKDIAAAEAFLRSEFTKILRPGDSHASAKQGNPDILMLIGVNGGGKTTTAAKLSALLIKEGKKPMLIAADTFRAAAIEQLEHWAGKTGASFFRGMENADPASVVFDGLAKAAREGCDAVIIDTAGRLHTQDNLMQELVKVGKTAEKAAPQGRLRSLMIIDANTGKNAVSQAKLFSGAIPVDGLVLTKIDSTSKGGSIIRIRKELGLPVRYVTFGESLEDIEEFDAVKFTDNLFS